MELDTNNLNFDIDRNASLSLNTPRTPDLVRSMPSKPPRRRSSTTSSISLPVDVGRPDDEYTDNSDEFCSSSSNGPCFSIVVNDDCGSVILNDEIIDASAQLDSLGVVNSSSLSVAANDEDFLRRRSASVLEMTGVAQNKLKWELEKAQSELKLRDEERHKLVRVQEEMNEELVELSAKLFEEANKMVVDANVKRMHTEKLLKEVTSKNDVLQAEVTALKELVLTSTPSMPNRHLHPQLRRKKESSTLSKFIPGHRRMHSDQERKETNSSNNIKSNDSPPEESNKELEPVYLEQFRTWRLDKPTDLNRDSIFLKQIINDDIIPCLSFNNNELSSTLLESILNNTITIEPIADKNPFPRKCSLTLTTRVCGFKIQIQDPETWHVISQLVRNRIASVCDLLSYLRYIIKGLVKSNDGDIYWEIIRLRKEINLARLGLR